MPAAGLFDGRDLSYATDDGLPFLGWAPPAIDEGEAQDRYDSGERFAVLAGAPTDPDAALQIDRRNGRVVVTRAEDRRQLVFGGKDELTLDGASWVGTDGDRAVELVAERRGSQLLRVRRRPVGAVVWLDELLARAPEPVAEAWPAFGDWDGLARLERPPAPNWWDDGVLDLVDADGWLLDELDDRDVAGRWRELARKQDAPRAYSQPPEVQAKLAEPLGWRPQGRRWRRASEPGGVTVLTDVSFVAGAGGGSDVVVTVIRGDVEVVVPLPVATGRLEARTRGMPASPAQPRPSASAQIGITAVLEIAGEVHDAVTRAVAEGAIPDGWSRLAAPSTT